MRIGVYEPPIYRDHRNPFLKAGCRFSTNGVPVPPTGGITTPPMLHGLLEALPSVVEVYATLWREAAGAGERSEVRARLDQSLAALRAFAAIIPIARSRALSTGRLSSPAARW